MSQTLAATELNVRKINGDLDAANYGLSSERLRSIIIGIAQNWVVKLGVPETWDSAVFSFVSGQSENALDLQYSKITNVRCAQTGTMLQRVTMGEYGALVSGQSNASPALGEPIYYTLTESDGFIVMKVFPAANRALDYDASVVHFQDDEATVVAGGFPISSHALRGIESQSAADASLAMGAENRARLKIDDAAMGKWNSDAAMRLRDEYIRLGRMREHSHIPAQVN